MSSSDHQRIEADVDEDLDVYTSQTPLVNNAQTQQQSSSQAESHQPAAVSGTISGSSSQQQSQAGSHSGPHRQVIGGVALESRYGGSSTLDEPLSATLLRDVQAISTKVVQVLWPTPSAAPLRDWDLWGPLLFCLSLAVLLSLGASAEQSLAVFTGVFVIVSVGSVVVTVNCKLLGGKVSFFQSLCVLGYCLAPLDLAALVTVFIRMLWIRLPVCALCFAWSSYAAVNFLGGTRLEDSRALLAVYPCCLLFFLLSWITLLS